jgi:hypothetical protein
MKPLERASVRLRENPPDGWPGKPGRPRKHVEAAEKNGSAVVRASSAPSSNWHPAVTSQAVAETPKAAVPADVPVRTPKIMPRALGIRDAAGYLSVSTWTIRDLLEAGTLKRIRVPVPPSENRKGVELRRLLIDKADLDDLLDHWRST